MADRLELMFELQKELQRTSFQTDPAELDGDTRAAWMAQMVLGTLDEVHEALEHVGWKAHGRSRHFDRDAFAAELIDVLHYLIALFLAAGWSPRDVAEAFTAKATVIAARQARGHDGRRQR